MDQRLVCQILLAVLFYSSASALPHPSNGLRECRKNNSLLALEVLPGGGWDNLRNRDMGRVMNFSYSQCQTTEDGIYLIPDEVFVIPQKTTNVDKSSEVFEHWLNYSSSDSQTISAHASYLSVLNGKYSSESKRVKTYQVRDKSVTSRVQVRNHLYTVDAYPDFTLDARFIQQVKEIAEALLNNNTRHATFLSEMMVVDYGTHVITSVDAGAILEQEDYIKSSYYSSGDKSKLTRSAGLSFSKGISFGIDTSESHETSEMTSYESQLTHSLMQSQGGTSFYPGITLKTWQESIVNNLVAIDRAGLPLHFILNRATLPDLAEASINKVSQFLRQAIQRYYNINARPGCVDLNSQNFNFQANVDDNSCIGPATNLSLGGVYQTCTPITHPNIWPWIPDPDAGKICEKQKQENPDTGDFSCRPPYQSVLLQSVVVEETVTNHVCEKHCKRHWLFFKSCEQECHDNYYVRRATVNTYWCATSQAVKPYSGYLFGGLYSSNQQNPVTKSMGCPAHFFPSIFLSNGFKICLSNDYEQASPFSVPFGGFFSCKAPNPLAWSQSRCPPEFSQHLATISDGCQVLFCVKSGVFTDGQLLPIHLPPFTHPALIRKAGNNTLVMLTEENQVWLRIQDSNSWQRAKPGDAEQYMRQLHASGLEWGEITAGVGIACFSIMLAIGIAFMVRRKMRGRSASHEEAEAFLDTRREGYETFSHTQKDSRV